MAGIKYDIEKEIGVISQSSKGWNKELNLVSWNNREAKYDIRDWDEDHQKMGKGITFTKEELINLKELLNSIDI
ncbi:MAG: PC4/YdbC family ssDNA-binding protein [Peptostreptococcaceae bacterium]|nr:PC4/YdbC family ssDNA-binding protein [Peptostreptococcaceae bacterium]MDU4936444.1 PC4/YdbC family ssDNA-binding protein [Peptostreptococcaceae bacterium]